MPRYRIGMELERFHFFIKTQSFRIVNNEKKKEKTRRSFEKTSFLRIQKKLFFLVLFGRLVNEGQFNGC